MLHRLREVIGIALASASTIGVTGCSEVPPTASNEGPAVGFITCAADGAHVMSPVVARPDGVHLVITAPDEFSVHVSGDPPVALGLLPGEFGPMVLDTSNGDAVSELGPGDYQIACRDGRTDTMLAVTSRLTITDPDGLWVDDQLRCADWSMGISDYAEGAQGEHGDLVAALRRHVTGLRPGDLVTPAGYPADDAREIRVVRDGTVVAVATYEEHEPGNWLLSTFEVCASSGIMG